MQSVTLVQQHKNTGLYTISPKALNFLHTLDPATRVHVVSIAGRAKSGKSFLLNKLYETEFKKCGHAEPFRIWYGVEKCTATLQMYPQLIQVQQGKQLCLVLDTAGLEGFTFVQNLQTLKLCTQLSSVLIYNCRKNLGKHELDYFEQLTDFNPSRVSSKSKEKPKIILAQREYTINSSQTALKTADTYSEYISKAGDFRGIINMPRPVQNQLDLRIPCNCKIRPQFSQQVSQLKSLIRLCLEDSKGIEIGQFIAVLEDILASFNRQVGQSSRGDEFQKVQPRFGLEQTLHFPQNQAAKINALASCSQKQVSQLAQTYKPKKVSRQQSSGQTNNSKEGKQNSVANLKPCFDCYKRILEPTDLRICISKISTRYSFNNDEQPEVEFTLQAELENKLLWVFIRTLAEFRGLNKHFVGETKLKNLQAADIPEFMNFLIKKDRIRNSKVFQRFIRLNLQIQ